VSVGCYEHVIAKGVVSYVHELTIGFVGRTIARVAEARLALRAHPGQSTSRVRALPAQGPIAAVGPDAPASGLPAGGCALHPHPRPGTLPCPRRVKLVRRETWFPRWGAEIDGRPTAIQSADGLFQAVTAPAGSHHIMFSFVPPSMDGALLGWLAGVAVMLVPAARSASSFRVRG
jgi:hypothetical protein